MTKLRVGAVSYLNARPLVHGLAQGLGRDRIALSLLTPAAVAAGMAQGALDIGLLPAIELGRLPDLELVPGLAIGSAGPARSVLLVGRPPLAAIERVALDPESRTSNALLRVLMAEVWGREVRYGTGGRDLAGTLAAHDAALRIGDKALFEALPPGVATWDLGQVWTEATGLPFVYAVWAARPGCLDPAILALFEASHRAGMQAIDQIADEAGGAVARDYLRCNIRYDLGAAELGGLRAFLAAAARIGLIPEAPELRFAPGCAVAPSGAA